MCWDSILLIWSNTRARTLHFNGIRFSSNVFYQNSFMRNRLEVFDWSRTRKKERTFSSKFYNNFSPRYAISWYDHRLKKSSLSTFHTAFFCLTLLLLFSCFCAQSPSFHFVGVCVRLFFFWSSFQCFVFAPHSHFLPEIELLKIFYGAHTEERSHTLTHTHKHARATFMCTVSLAPKKKVSRTHGNITKDFVNERSALFSLFSLV